jgi:hypothetical protein
VPEEITEIVSFLIISIFLDKFYFESYVGFREVSTSSPMRSHTGTIHCGTIYRCGSVHSSQITAEESKTTANIWPKRKLNKHGIYVD